MTEEIEIVFNLWYLTDESTGMVYSLLGRAYAMSGTDDEKLERLRDLAWTDWRLSKRYPVPATFSIVSPDGQRTIKGIIDPQALRDVYFESAYEAVFQDLEKEFPPQMVWREGDFHPEPQVASKTPLLVCTNLVEDEFGNVEARVSSQRKLEI